MLIKGSIVNDGGMAHVEFSPLKAFLSRPAHVDSSTTNTLSFGQGLGSSQGPLDLEFSLEDIEPDNSNELALVPFAHFSIQD